MHAYGSSVSQTSLNHSLFSTITRLMFMFNARLQTSLPLLSLGTNLIITFSFLKAMILLFWHTLCLTSMPLFFFFTLMYFFAPAHVFLAPSGPTCAKVGGATQMRWCLCRADSRESFWHEKCPCVLHLLRTPSNQIGVRNWPFHWLDFSKQTCLGTITEHH